MNVNLVETEKVKEKDQTNKDLIEYAHLFMDMYLKFKKERILKDK
ncbi:MAG: hypothetical protein ACFFBP_17665 [Promethearchaeota archaeon]